MYFWFLWRNLPRNWSKTTVDLLNVANFSLCFEHSESTDSSYCRYPSLASWASNCFSLNNLSARTWNFIFGISFSSTIAFGDKEEAFLTTKYLSRHFLPCMYYNNLHIFLSEGSFSFLVYIPLRNVITLKLFQAWLDPLLACYWILQQQPLLNSLLL